MFKATLNNPIILKTSFEAISNIVDTARIECDNEGIRLNAIDRSHIIFCNLELHKSLFESYNLDEPTRIDIDTTELMKVLKRAKNTDFIEITTTDTNLILQFKGETNRTFKIRMIDIEYDAPTPPNIEYQNRIEMPVSLLKNSLNDISIFGDKIVFQLDQDHLRLTAEGNFGDTCIEYVHGEKVEDNVEVMFSLDKLNTMLRADKFSDTALLDLGTGLPLNLTLEMITGDGGLSFLLAPRIDSGED